MKADELADCICAYQVKGGKGGGRRAYIDLAKDECSLGYSPPHVRSGQVSSCDSILSAADEVASKTPLTYIQGDGGTVKILNFVYID